VPRLAFLRLSEWPFGEILAASGVHVLRRWASGPEWFVLTNNRRVERPRDAQTETERYLDTVEVYGQADSISTGIGGSSLMRDIEAMFVK
jgi:hypothetical protein